MAKKGKKAGRYEPINDNWQKIENDPKTGKMMQVTKEGLQEDKYKDTDRRIKKAAGKERKLRTERILWGTSRVDGPLEKHDDIKGTKAHKAKMKKGPATQRVKRSK